MNLDMFAVNQLVHNLQGEERTIERIAWINWNAPEAYCYLINMESKKFEYRECKLVNLLQQLEAGDAILPQDDPWLNNLPVYKDLTPKGRSKFDVLWPLFEAFLNAENIETLFIKKELNRRINGERNLTGSQILTALRKYFMFGQIPMAIAPSYHLRGHGKKRVDKSFSKHYTGASICHVTPELLFTMRQGYQKYYVKKPQNSLRSAYREMLANYFSRPDPISGKPELLPKNEYPSYPQFRRHCHIPNKESVLIQRQGALPTELNDAPKTGSANLMAFGPAVWYTIDSTPADIQLVSRLNRARRIGKPTIYFVYDLFSMAIVGYAIILGSPSWIHQTMALLNAAEDKVSYCAKYGIEIEQDDWPMRHIPEYLMGDRGELLSHEGDHVAQSLGISIVNNAPYMPKNKGPVELGFNLLNQYLLNQLPGGGKPQGRGKKDLVGIPCLTLYELNVLVIEFILALNKAHLKKEYAPEEFMILDEVPPIPNKLWQWGLKNRSGLPRTIPQTLLYKCLLPRDNGSISKQGIRFRKSRYTVDDHQLKAEERSWYFQARNKRQQVEIAFDPRDASQVYLCLPDKRFIECTLLKREEAFQNMSWIELADYEEYFRKQKRNAQHNWNQALAQLGGAVKTVVTKAVEQAKQAQESSGLSKTALTKNVLIYRAADSLIENALNMGEIMAMIKEQEELLLDTTDEESATEQYVYPDYSADIAQMLLEDSEDE